MGIEWIQVGIFGNLIKDSSERISNIKWNVYGKIIEIDHRTTTPANPTKNIYYYYDAAGHRIGKKVTRGDTSAVSYTWYVRDASGNVMSTYTASIDSTQALGNADLQLNEQHIYGSSRLGILTANRSADANTEGLNNYTSPWTGMHLPYYTGKKQYELTNHLGNVLATISDKKIGVSLAQDSSLIDHYEADVQTAQDYYPFGMIMPGRMLTTLNIPGGTFSGTTQVNGYTLPTDLTLTGRTGNQPTSYVASDLIDLNEGFESGLNDDVTAYIADGSYAGGGNGSNDAGITGGGKYRYGFGGQEKSDEIKSIGNSYTAEFWEYDPRIGRRWNIDPITQHNESPYSAFHNNSVLFNDPQGDDPPKKPGFWTRVLRGLSGDFYKTRAENFANEHKIDESKIIDVGQHTLVIIDDKNENDIRYNIFRKAKADTRLISTAWSGEDDDLNVSKSQLASMRVQGNNVVDAPMFGGGAASAIEGIAVMGGRSRLAILGVVSKTAEVLQSYKNVIRFGVSGHPDVVVKGFHLHFDEIKKGLELGLRPLQKGGIGFVQVGKLSVGTANDIKKAIELFNGAMSNSRFRAELLLRLKVTQEYLQSTFKGATEAQQAIDKAHELNYLIKAVEKF